jgi:hypothetical protein
MSHFNTPRASSRRRFAFTLSNAIESLELRRLMHAGHDHGTGVASPAANLPTAYDVLPAGVLAKFDDGGHITRSEYLDLSIEEQAIVNPHSVEDDRTLEEQHAELIDLPQGRAGGDAAIAYPDLVPLVGGGYLQPYLDQTEQPGRNLLRFSTAVGNQGQGPAILFSGNTSEYALPDGRQLVKQRLFNFENNVFTQAEDREAGRFVYHPQHGHFHLEDYATYRLLNADGSQVMRADGTVAEGDKVGFCLININSSFTTTSGASSSTLPGYNRTGQPSTSCGFLQGIHVGRADVYDSIYDGQWIDVTGVANGSYLLEVTLDASNAMMESNEVNNTVRVPVTLNATTPTGGIALDRFDLLTNGGPNNTIATATNLGELGVQTQSGLTMHADSDVDYFRFTAASTGSYAVELSVANRIVDLYVYDDALTELGRNTTPTQGTTSSPVTKRVTTNFIEGHTYYVRAEGFSGSGTGGDTGGLSNNYALKVFINPTVRAGAPLAAAAEDGLAEGSFTIARNGPFSSALIVNFSLGGTAERGVDYDLMYNGSVLTGNSMTIGVEALTETIRVVPKTDAAVEAAETVTLTLSTNAAYVVGAGAAAALVTLADTAPKVLASTFKPLVNAVSFDFSLDVSASLAASDLILTDIATGLPTAVTASSVAWNPTGQTATFTLNGPLPQGNFRATLAAASVTHAQGAALAADASVDFSYLPADGNLDGVVDFADLVPLSQHYNLAGTFGDGDYNYDGTIDFADLIILSQNYNAGTVPPGGVSSVKPTATATPVVPKTRVGGKTGRIAAEVL